MNPWACLWRVSLIIFIEIGRHTHCRWYHPHWVNWINGERELSSHSDQSSLQTVDIMWTDASSSCHFDFLAMMDLELWAKRTYSSHKLPLLENFIREEETRHILSWTLSLNIHPKILKSSIVHLLASVKGIEAKHCYHGITNWSDKKKTSSIAGDKHVEALPVFYPCIHISWKFNLYMQGLAWPFVKLDTFVLFHNLWDLKKINKTSVITMSWIKISTESQTPWVTFDGLQKCYHHFMNSKVKARKE